MKNKMILYRFPAAALALLFWWNMTCVPITAAAPAATNQIHVQSSGELFTALRNAQPGDEIIVAEGTFEGKLGSSASGDGSSFFFSDRSGTADAPIILRSENPDNKSVLSGSRFSGQVLRITGDYWVISDLEFTNAQKGVVFDHSNYSKLINCDVYYTGNEAIHLRDNSSFNLIDGCTVSDTGHQTAGYGEGIYVGSAGSSWNTYGAQCDNNVIQNCTLGPAITAEHFDIKEGTTGTVIRNCIMYGDGITGQNYADSFVDIKGNEALLENNICYRNNNLVIVDAFQLHQQLSGWGLNNEINGNTVYMDQGSGYVINAAGNTNATADNNIRVPAGDMYNGAVTVIGEQDNPGDTGNSDEPGGNGEPGGNEEPGSDDKPGNEVLQDTYSDSVAYVGGDVVIYGGHTYRARWWTMGSAPNADEPWGPWELID